MPTLPPPSSLTLDRARKVDQRLSALFESRRQNLAAIAHELAVMKRDGLYGYLGYSSVFAYAFERHGMGKSKVSELIGISEGSRELPQTREAFDSGKLPWTKAREVVKAATPETEVEWLERSTTLTGDELRSARKGEPLLLRRMLSFSPLTAARFDQLLAAAKREFGVHSDADALLALLERGACGGGSEAPLRTLLITECRECGKATTESREGPVSVDRAEVARTRCSGEVMDEREGRVKRAIPTHVQRRVRNRDRRRCQVCRRPLFTATAWPLYLAMRAEGPDPCFLFPKAVLTPGSCSKGG